MSAEVVCTRCGETFLPIGVLESEDGDLVGIGVDGRRIYRHWQTLDGVDCYGLGEEEIGSPDEDRWSDVQAVICEAVGLVCPTEEWAGAIIANVTEED